MQQRQQVTSPNSSQNPPLCQNQRHCVTNFSVLPPPAATRSPSSAYEGVDRRRMLALYWGLVAGSLTTYTALNEFKSMCMGTMCSPCLNCTHAHAHTTVCTPLSVHHCLHTTVCTPLSAHHCLYTTVCTPLSVHHCLYTTVCTPLSAHHCLSTYCAIHNTQHLIFSSLILPNLQR